MRWQEQAPGSPGCGDVEGSQSGTRPVRRVAIHSRAVCPLSQGGADHFTLPVPPPPPHFSDLRGHGKSVVQGPAVVQAAAHTHTHGAPSPLGLE